jgi:predicted HicB family RNase H-like nuclease
MIEPVGPPPKKKRIFDDRWAEVIPTIRVRKEVRKALDEIAAMEGITVTEYVRALLESLARAHRACHPQQK